MTEFFLTYHKQIQAGTYGFLLIILLSLEFWAPRRIFHFSRWVRIISNLSLAAINNILLQVSFPILALGAGYVAVENGWGLFQILNWPGILELLLGVLLLDLIIYGQHIAFHQIPFFWRFHKVHHADLDLDVTSGLRFHPIEIFFSMFIKIGAILLLGVPPLTVFVFEMILMLSSMFNHSNLNIPLGMDKYLRFFIITPDFHRVHHSIVVNETNSNYGFNFPWWDRLFKTYRAQPRAGHTEMKIGIKDYRAPRWLYLQRVLIEPFVRDSESNP